MGELQNSSEIMLAGVCTYMRPSMLTTLPETCARHLAQRRGDQHWQGLVMPEPALAGIYRLGGQAVCACFHGWPVRRIALSVTMSLRMMAVMTTLAGLPLCLSFSA